MGTPTITDGFASEAVLPRLISSPRQLIRRVAQSSRTSSPEPSPPLRRSIYALTKTPGYRVKLEPFSITWQTDFNQIRDHLQNLFTNSTPPANFETIEHIGSTSITGLCAKPNIDILITFPSNQSLCHAIDALLWEIPNNPPYARYTRIPNGGGIQGRESFKLYLPPQSPYYASTPERSVYLIHNSPENHAGQVQIGSYRTLKTVLLNPKNRDLFDKYNELKLSLAQETFENSLIYSARKNDVVREILVRGGWTHEEVDEKEFLSKREWVVDEDDLPY